MVSLIIPVYRQERYVKEALLSVLAQGLSNIEVIVIDDCSPFREELDRDIGLLFADFEFIRVLQTPRNLGLAGARNFGIKHATGDLILPLDADDLLAPNALSNLQAALHKSEAAVAYGNLLRFGEQNSRWAQPGGWSVTGLIAENRLPYASLFRRSAWELVGGYDENMRDGYEDWDFWIRLALAGLTFVHVDATTLLYRRHGLSMIDKAAAAHDKIIQYMHGKYEALLGLAEKPDKEKNKIRRTLELPVSSEFASFSWRSFAEDGIIGQPTFLR